MDVKDIENRWFPPSPHKEAVVEFLNKGRAHLEERGHNIPPLLVFEDGGVMELPKARYKDGNFSPDESSQVSRQTNYSDVCGTIDEFKNLLQTQPELAENDPSRLFELLDDVCYLLSRMQRRREAYKSAVEAVVSMADKLKQVTGPNVEDAYQKADVLKEFLNESPDRVSGKLDELFNIAEEMRDVANRIEQEALYPYRDLFIELGEIYTQIKGSRTWKKKVVQQ
jgi:hypothetical protein